MRMFRRSLPALFILPALFGHLFGQPSVTVTLKPGRDANQPIDEEYTDYFFVMSCLRDEGDASDQPTGRSARWIELQQNIIKQDFFTWENMKYLEHPSFAVEEAKDYAALRRWARRFYPADSFGDGRHSDG